MINLDWHFLWQYIIMPVLTGAIGVIGAGIVYNLEFKYFGFTALGAIISGLAYNLITVYVTDSLFFTSLISAVVLALYCDIISHNIKAPATILLIPGILPLVPGGKLYYATLSLIKNQQEACTGYLRDALNIALGLAVGVVFVTFVMRRIVFVPKRIRRNFFNWKDIRG